MSWKGRWGIITVNGSRRALSLNLEIDAKGVFLGLCLIIFYVVAVFCWAGNYKPGEEE